MGSKVKFLSKEKFLNGTTEWSDVVPVSSFHLQHEFYLYIGCALNQFNVSLLIHSWMLFFSIEIINIYTDTTKNM